MKKVFNIKGMHCNSCSTLIENKLKDRVNSIEVSYSKGKAEIDFESEFEAPDGTADVAAAAFVVYSDGDVAADVIEALWKRYMPYPVRQAKVSNDDELGD